MGYIWSAKKHKPSLALVGFAYCGLTYESGCSAMAGCTLECMMDEQGRLKCNGGGQLQRQPAIGNCLCFLHNPKARYKRVKEAEIVATRHQTPACSRSVLLDRSGVICGARRYQV